MIGIPVEAPAAGPLWGLVVPSLLFLFTLAATWLLYRHFSERE